jgi:two-component system, chemotaxis family, protein-glutamate methylesterase/glutaminase
MSHDVVTIGASAGGLEVLREMALALPADLPASLFVVLHTVAGRTSQLPRLLSGRLPASHPVHDEKILPGRIYIAPPDNHLLVRQGSMEVVRGPKENGHRPSADPLFRTASAAYGPRVIGVVLSGYQDCGTAGMMSIKARGGLSVVQDPKTAIASEMPASVLARVAVDHIVAPQELAALIARLVREPGAKDRQPDEGVKRIEGLQAGKPAELVCPTCQGVLTEAQAGVFQHFRCHVGHAFSLESLVREQSEEMERALWASVRSLEEGAALSRRLSLTETGDLKERFAEKAGTQLQQAELIREILLHGERLSAPDAAQIAPGSRSRKREA